MPAHKHLLDNERPRPHWTKEPLQEFWTLAELRTPELWRAVAAEGFATFAFLFFVVSTVVYRAEGVRVHC